MRVQIQTRDEKDMDTIKTYKLLQTHKHTHVHTNTDVKRRRTYGWTCTRFDTWTHELMQVSVGSDALDLRTATGIGSLSVTSAVFKYGWKRQFSFSFCENSFISLGSHWLFQGYWTKARVHLVKKFMYWMYSHSTLFHSFYFIEERRVNCCRANSFRAAALSLYHFFTVLLTFHLLFSFSRSLLSLLDLLSDDPFFSSRGERVRWASSQRDLL